MTKPRILFFGYSEVGFECLSLLLERGDNVVALITHEDNPNEKIWFQTPAVAARAKGVPVHTPASVNTPEWMERIAQLAPDLILSAYYRNMIAEKILGLAPLGAFNLHGSLLPKYRGRAPINWAVLHGEPRIGMTLHRMVKKADAGAIVDQQGVDIGPRDTAEQAFRKVLPCACAVLARQIDALLAGAAPETPQDASQATYFGGRKPEDGRINWNQSSAQIFNLIRAVTDPYPGAFTDIGATRLMVWWAEPSTFRNVGPALVAAPHSSGVATSLRAGGPVADAPQSSDVATGLRAGGPAADAPPPQNVGPSLVAAPHLDLVGPSLVDAPQPGMASSASPTPRKPQPGEILSLAPLIIATGDGALELTRTEICGTAAPALHVGQIL